MKKFLKKLFAAVICIIIILTITAAINIYKAYHIKKLSSDDIATIAENKATKLMIVAHPDDETIWGGMHLLDGEYFVVCITNGNNSVRKEEFYNVLEQSGNDGIILSYPDKVCGRRDDWEKVWDYIVSDIGEIIEAKNWEIIVTHNPDGEYGHIHHKLTSSIVTEKCKENGLDNLLWYFGKYYRKSEVEKIYGDMREYDSEKQALKEHLLSLYESQGRTVKKLEHMNPYENWISYDKWEKD